MHCCICDKDDAKYTDGNYYCEECQDWHEDLMYEYGVELEQGNEEESESDDNY